MTLDKEDLDDRQRHLLDVLTREFEEALLLGTASGTALYQRLRQHLTANWATEADLSSGPGSFVRSQPGTEDPNALCFHARG
jgi:hypothetical protein